MTLTQIFGVILVAGWAVAFLIILIRDELRIRRLVRRRRCR